MDEASRSQIRTNPQHAAKSHNMQPIGLTNYIYNGMVVISFSAEIINFALEIVCIVTFFKRLLEFISKSASGYVHGEQVFYFSWKGLRSEGTI